MVRHLLRQLVDLENWEWELELGLDWEINVESLLCHLLQHLFFLETR